MKKESNPTKLLFIFLTAIFVLAVLSVAYKLFMQIRESRFEYETFNILAIDKDAYLFHVNSKENKLVTIKFPGGRERYINKTKLLSSVEIGIPLDAVIVADNQIEFKNGNIQLGTVFNSILSEGSYEMEDINNYDLFKINLAMNSVPTQNRENIEANNKGKVVIKDYIIIRDRQIFNDKVSIQIVNSTGIDGIGAKVGQMLVNAGYNVVSTETGEEEDSQIKVSGIEKQNDKNVKRLEKIFGVEDSSIAEGLISDVSIILGKDLKSSIEQD